MLTIITNTAQANDHYQYSARLTIITNTAQANDQYQYSAG